MPDASPYDALLLVSFGGPEGPEDVVPFLRNVTAGRGIPDERLAEVGQHYYSFGGRSPINDQNRALLSAIRADLAAAGVDVPVYWGNRNWDPYLRDTLARMKEDGVTRAACFLTSAYSSYSGCRQYREDLAAAVDAVPGAPRLDRLHAYFDHEGLLAPTVDVVRAALAESPSARLLFVTHSIPVPMNEASGPGGGQYLAQHRAVMAEVAERVGAADRAELVFCSRSGPPAAPWLEPDVNDRLRELAEAGCESVVLVPIGFVSDHMEVVYDLDTEAAATARDLGLHLVRVATPGTDARFVAMVRDLLLERAEVERGARPDAEGPKPRPGLRGVAANPDLCVAGCCANPRSNRRAICGAD